MDNLAWAVVVAVFVSLVTSQPLVEQDFSPIVTATCKAGYMTIKVQTNSSFIGALHAKDFRTPSCLTYGNGSSQATLVVNLFAPVQSPEYCGVLVSNKTDERSLPIAVRIHKTLELADDKFYVITCGKAGFKNAKNETSLVSLKIMDMDKKRRLQEVFYSHPYVIRADISRPDGTYGIRVKSCFAFNRRNSSVQLIDDRGCPINKAVLTPFTYNDADGHADSTLFAMFQFSDGNQVHFQCDVGVCKGGCPPLNCDDDIGIRAPTDGGVIVASTSVFVLQPGDPAALAEVTEASIWHGSWPLYLALVLGLLFLLMLILNVFLCSAMSCSCSRSQIIEKEPSIIEDYDPYRSWHGTHYSSRYSLNGKNGGYRSGGSTLNSARSVSTNSDHYAIVESSRHRDRQPPVHMGYPKH
ncbi:Zona pellucida-like domain [Nesidiocoris tenuis]|uniref:Zona pellucida-like domain n=1 Tax=Nesidiocoris tenuis TaxID=355587 RepID=A0ABN7B8C1_9HEMI|nr:Zona pellucida-like domain [Nesidiocoris tenuis]